MPREPILDTDLEAFLARLEGVHAVRVVAHPTDGTIEHVHVTTEGARDIAGVRRAIMSALLSQFKQYIDGWRIHVVPLDPVRRAETLPECQVVRLEETITEARTRVLVEVRYEWEGQTRTATGSAQGPPGQGYRLRTVALAAIDAIRPLAQQVVGRPSLEAVAVAPFAGMTVVLAAVSITSEHASQIRLGAASATSSEPEATVVAIIDALTKPARPAMGERPRPSDRRTRFEGLRRQHERLLRLDVNAPLPAPRQVMPRETGEEVDAAGEESTGVSHDADASEPYSPPPIEGAHDVSALEEVAAAHHVAAVPVVEHTETAADVISDMSEIRPEPEGGAASMMREEARGEGTVPAARSMPRASLEDQFYRRLAVTGVKVHIRCRDGHEIPTAVVKDFGPYSLLIEADGLTQLVFKHAIIAIRPYGPLPPEHTVPS